MAEILARGGFGDIASEGPDLAAALAHFVGGFGQSARIACIQHDIAAGFRGRKGNDAAKAAAAAGDEQHAAHRAGSDQEHSCRSLGCLLCPSSN